MFRRMLGQRRTEKPKLTPQRLQFYADEHGHLDLARTHPDNLERLKVGISSEPVRQALGLVQSESEAPAVDSSTLTGYLIDTVNDALAEVARRKWQLTDDQKQLLLLQRDPKTRDTVTSLTDALLKKYFPNGFGNYHLELSLAIVVFGFVKQSMALVGESKARSSATSGPVPVEGRASSAA